MPLILAPARASDSLRIAELHMLAFGPNAMLRAIFPTPDSRAMLQQHLERKALIEIESPLITVLVVRLVDQMDTTTSDLSNQIHRAERITPKSDVIGFAKWEHPTDSAGEHEEPPRTQHKGAALDVSERWSQACNDSLTRVMGSTPCYKLHFIGTDPLHRQLGAGSMMVQWGVEQCEKSGQPAYLESTLGAAAFYEKNGFAASGTLSCDIPHEREEGRTATYKEVAFVYNPKKTYTVGPSREDGLEGQY